MVNLSKNSESLQTWACLVGGFLFCFQNNMKTMFKNLKLKLVFNNNFYSHF